MDEQDMGLSNLNIIGKQINSRNIFCNSEQNILSFVSGESSGVIKPFNKMIFVAQDDIFQTFLVKFQHFIPEGEHLSEVIKSLQNSFFCIGFQEKTVLPKLSSVGIANLTSALFLIDKCDGEFVYRSRKCKHLVGSDKSCCESCLDLFENICTDGPTDQLVNSDMVMNDGLQVEEMLDTSKSLKEGILNFKKEKDLIRLVENKDETVNKIECKTDIKSNKNKQCSYCDERFIYERSLNKHLLKFHNKKVLDKEKTYSCLQCNNICASESLLQKHVKKVHGETKNGKKNIYIKCHFCPDEYKISEGETMTCFYKIHLQKKHSDKDLSSFKDDFDKIEQSSLVCPICGGIYGSKNKVDAHIKKMHFNTNEIVSCNICGKSLKRLSLPSHVTNAHSDPKFICTVCGSKFKQESYLRYHMRTHNPGGTEKHHQCEECGKKFVNGHTLRKHITWTHQKNFKFECQHCSKLFRSPQHLSVHIRSVHTKEKPFPCEECGFTCARLDNLNLHRKKVHKLEKISRSQIEQIFGLKQLPKDSI